MPSLSLVEVVVLGMPSVGKAFHRRGQPPTLGGLQVVCAESVGLQQMAHSYAYMR